MDYKGMGKDSAKLLWNKIKAKFLSKDTKYAASDSVGGNAIKANTSVGVTDFNDASRNIKIGYSGNSLTAGEVGYLAGYNSAGNIKDISKNEAKKWLGINGGSQTTTSTEDGGANVYTFSDGSTVTVRNGSRGSQGPKGETGDAGPQGATGPQGPQGPRGEVGPMPSLAGVIVRDEMSFSITVAKNSYARYTKDIPTKAGYAPVLAVPKGTSNRNVLCYGYEIIQPSNTTFRQIETKWTNVSGADRTCTAEVYILYVKN